VQGRVVVRAVAWQGGLTRGARAPSSKQMTEPTPRPKSPGGAPHAASKKPLSPAAQRALAEAEARRRAAGVPQRPAEVQGRGGLDPTRYGDWEVKGIASDF